MTALKETLQAQRAKIAEIKEQLENIDNLRVPRAEWQARADEWIDRQAAEFQERVGYDLGAMTAPTWPRGPNRPRIGANVFAIHGEPDAVAGCDLSAPLAWLFQAELKKRVADVISATDYDAGPPMDERPALKAKLEGDLRATEQAEEITCREIDATGEYATRRADALPEIVLAWADQLTPEPKRRASK